MAGEEPELGGRSRWTQLHGQGRLQQQTHHRSRRAVGPGTERSLTPPKPPQRVQEPESIGAKRPRVSQKTAWQMKTELSSFSTSWWHLCTHPSLLKNP